MSSGRGHIFFTVCSYNSFSINSAERDIILFVAQTYMIYDMKYMYFLPFEREREGERARERERGREK